MHDTLVTVFVVALSLLSHPIDDPGLEEWDGTTVQEHGEGLLREEDKLHQKIAPVSEEITHADSHGPQAGAKNIPSEESQSDQHVIEKNEMSVSEVVSITEEEDGADHKSPETGNAAGILDNQADGSSHDSSRAQEHQGEPVEQEESPLSNLHTKTSENQSLERAASDWEGDYLWYLWNIFSIISMIRFLRKYLERASQMKPETRPFPVKCTAAEVPLPDSETLQRFHSKCIQASSDKRQSDGGFLDGFATDLLHAMKKVCSDQSGMVIEDFQTVDACEIIVPFRPPDLYSFQCLPWNSQANGLLPDVQVCGQIKLVENKQEQNVCPCQSPDADDMVCLLHCETEKVETKVNVCDDFCVKNSTFLSKSQVTRWFQGTIKQAWSLISHKYEFELHIRYLDAPGALMVRFRSGKKISFSMTPVVKFNAKAHFFIESCSPNNMDSLWTLSLTKYEDCFLEHVSERLPENSCHIHTLEIARFLHRRQTALSGGSALKDFHFKAALMHLLLTKQPSEWKANNVTVRLRDLLGFMEKSLKKKLLPHALIGNPLTQRIIELPAEFARAKNVNLFHPLVAHDCIYRDAVMYFQELLNNAHMLILDYADQDVYYPCLNK